ncbi:MAG: hypothetical protein PUP93_02560 [Rhizonema sp. NSF051]|nr:hypothetical protein [Rhizonema sp. NSF051]
MTKPSLDITKLEELNPILLHLPLLTSTATEIVFSCLRHMARLMSEGLVITLIMVKSYDSNHT